MASFTIADREFTDPNGLAHWQPPRRAGLYAVIAVKKPVAITLLQDRPPGRLIYIGQSGNMDERGFANHHKRQCWFDHLGPDEALVVATDLMPIQDSNPVEMIRRGLIEEKIRRLYSPPCND